MRCKLYPNPVHIMKWIGFLFYFILYSCVFAVSFVWFFVCIVFVWTVFICGLTHAAWYEVANSWICTQHVRIHIPKTIVLTAWPESFFQTNSYSNSSNIPIRCAATVKNSDRRFFGWRGARGGSLGPPADDVTMATPLGILRDCTHPSLNETLKTHSNVTFKLVKTGE